MDSTTGPGAVPQDADVPRAGAWRTWLAIGCTGFGGPAGQLAILHREIVERRHWLSEEEFLAAMKVCMLLPGPEAQQVATYAGWRLGGIRGGLIAGGLFVLPGAVIVTLMAWLHAAGSSLPLVSAAFAGTRPAVVALVAFAAWRIGRKSLATPAAGALAAVAGAALVAGVPFPLVVLVAAVVGWLLPLSPTPAGAAAATQAAPADTSLEEARAPAAAPSLSRLRLLVVTTLIAGVVWAAAFVLVRASGAAGGRGGEIATLFTETTLLSLGGAYAVVPWALDESLARGWLEPAERFAALAMGEATPGPLILVVTFIGFLAGWKTDPGGAVPGLEGAAIATCFAFLPSFAVVFGIAPLVRRVKAGTRLARMMSAVGAVVVAAIVVLACRLAGAAFLPDGTFDPTAFVVAAACAAALFLKVGGAPLVVAAAAAFAVLRAVLWPGG
jgi:chromate transporter